MQPPGAPAPPSPAQPPVVLLSIATVLVGVWIVAGTALLQGVGWFVAELLFSLGEPVPPWAWPVVAWINAGLVAAPTGLVWALARHVAGGGPHLVGARAAGRAWTIIGVAAGFVGDWFGLRAAIGACAAAAGLGGLSTLPTLVRSAPATFVPEHAR